MAVSIKRLVGLSVLALFAGASPAFAHHVMGGKGLVIKAAGSYQADDGKGTRCALGRVKPRLPPQL